MQTDVENRVTPKLRFGEFDGDWEIKSISNTSEIVGGGTPETSKSEYWGGEIQWFTPTELKSKFVSKSVRTISELGLKKSSAKILPKGTLLFSSRATIGDVSLALLDCTTNQGFQSLIVNEDNNTEFLYQWITNNKKVFLRRASGSTFLEISKKEIAKIKLHLPSLPEQQKIAFFLSSVDEKLQQLNIKKSLLEDYKKGVMQKIFSQELRFKDANGNNYPDWEEKKLGEVFDFRRGKNISENKEGKQFLLGMGSVSEQGKLITKKRTNNNHLLSKNDLVMPERDIGMGYIIGRVAIIDEDDRYVLGANILSLSPKDDILSHFIYYQINDNIFRKKMRRIINGSAQLMITSKDVIKLQLQLPVFEEQQKIANFLSAIDEKISLTNIQIDNTKAFKKGLLQQMFV